MADRNYLVPRQVTTRIELWPGFGLKELAAVALGGAVGYMIYHLAGLFGAGLRIQLIASMIPPAAAWAAVKGGDQSMAARGKQALVYMRWPKRLLYRMGSASGQNLPTPAQTTPQITPVIAFLLDLLPLPIRRMLPGRRPPEPPLPRTVQEWLPMRDVAGGLIYRRDGSLVAAIRVEPVNLALKTPAEQQSLMAALHEAFNSLQQPVQVLSVSRPLDLDAYVRSLEVRLREVDPTRQRLLRSYIRYVQGLVASGDAQERRYYLLLPQPAGPGAIEELLQRAQDLASRIQQADLVAHVLDDRELLDLLHVWTHPTQASFERPPLGPPAITTLIRMEV